MRIRAKVSRATAAIEAVAPAPKPPIKVAGPDHDSWFLLSSPWWTAERRLYSSVSRIIAEVTAFAEHAPGRGGHPPLQPLVIRRPARKRRRSASGGRSMIDYGGKIAVSIFLLKQNASRLFFFPIRSMVSPSRLPTKCCTAHAPMRLFSRKFDAG
jgi:hypothetical protein